MVKKSNVKIPAIQIIRLIVFLSLGFFFWACYLNVSAFLNSSPLFNVHNVVIDSSIQFIDMAELRSLKGRNIFKIDIKRLQARIKAQYPQIAQLQVMRELPDQIKVLAKKREMVFQTVYKGKTLLVDKEGVAMYYAQKPMDLPFVQGVLPSTQRVTLGAPVPDKTIRLALEIIRVFKSAVHLAQLKIVNIDISNLSKVEVTIAQGPRVILDQDNYPAKVQMLEALIAQRKINFPTVKYIDLRFSEPVLAENNEEPKSR